MHVFFGCKISRFFFSSVATVALVAAGLLVGCQPDQLPTEASTIGGPSFAISDGAHDGNPDFFFLPPVQPNPVNHPEFDNPDEADDFNDDLIPVVEICLLNGDPLVMTEAVCVGAPVKRFAPGEAQQVEVMYDDEHYLALWHTDESDLVADEFYRIQVFIGEILLGFADLDVVNSGKELKNVITGEFVPLKDGRTLPIKFRIEQGALCDPEAVLCFERTLDATQNEAVVLEDPAVPPDEWDRLDVPAQPDGVFHIINDQGEPDTTSLLTVAVATCEEGFLEDPVGGCLEVTTDKTLIALAEPAVVSICGIDLDEYPDPLLTIYRNHEGEITPLVHTRDNCLLNEPIGSAESTGLMRFAKAGWNAVTRPLVKVLAPQPLVASAPVVMHRGKGGITEEFSQFEVGLPPDKFASLVSWWPGDGHYDDLYGDNPGVPEGAVTFEPGIWGDAFRFSGTTGNVFAQQADTGYNFETLKELTVQAWVKLAGGPVSSIERWVTIAGSQAKAVLRHDGENNPGQLHFFMGFEDGEGGDVLEHIRADGLLAPRACFDHVVGTYDGEYMRLYLNGVEVGNNQVTGIVLDGDWTEIGWGADDEAFNGWIDEVAIFNEALSAGDIQAIYDAAGVGKCDPPVGYRVSGTVYYSTTELAGFTVELEQRDVPLQTTATDDYGYYEFESVQPGDYRIKTYGGGEYIGWYSSPIQVVSSDLTVDRYLPKNIVLLTPENGTDVSSLKPTLTWTPNDEADLAGDYRIQINDTDVWDPTFETGASATASYTVQTAMTPGENYTWQVDAYDVNSHWVGSTQEAFNFTVGMVLDQENDPTTGTSYGCPTLSSLYQSFIPSASSLGAVELRLRTGGSFPSGGTNTTINIRDGTPTGSSLATATTFVSDVSGQTLVTFPLSSVLTVTPGSPLVIEWLTTGDAILTWMGRDDDPYDGGNAFGCSGAADDTRDMNFKTYAPYTP